MQKLINWVDERLPIVEAWNKHLAKYYAPKNFNVWYFFGSLAMLVLVNQLVTGIWLTMSYNPSAEGGAFARWNTSCVMWSGGVGCCDTCTRPAHLRSSLWCICTCSVVSCTVPTRSRGN